MTVQKIPRSASVNRNDQFTHKVAIRSGHRVHFLTLCIRYESKGWYLFANDQQWGGPFDFPDQGADWAYLCPTPLPSVLGIEEMPATLAVSDRLPDWRRERIK